MWEKFTQGLGKVVQGLLNIFRKKKDNTQDWNSIAFSVEEDDEIRLGPRKITIMPLAQIDEAEITWEESKSYVGKKPEVFSDMSNEEYEELKKLLNAYLTDLPKHYWCKTLIVSCYADWEYDSIGIDISQLEEHSLAHFWCTSQKRMEEWDEELRARGIPIEEDTEGQEEHTVVHNVRLLEYPDGTWAWEEA